MNRLFRSSLLGLVLLLPAPAVLAQTTAVPPLMNFQGRLARPDGTPLVNGFYVVTFSLWNMANGGSVMTNQVWTETSAVTVRNGTFAVMLGKTMLLADSLFAGNLYLQIQVGNDAALTPRQQLISVGYAFRANIANTVPDGSITAAKLAPSLTFPPTGAAGGDLTGAYPNPFLSNNTVSADKLASDFASFAKVSGGAALVNAGGVSFDRSLYLSGNVNMDTGKLFGVALGDSFTCDGRTMGQESLAFVVDSWSTDGWTAWLSGYRGIKFSQARLPAWRLQLAATLASILRIHKVRWT